MQLLARLTGKPANLEQDARRLRPPESEVERLLAKSDLARELLGWEPKLSLEEGLTRTIAWLREQQGRYRPGVYVL